MFGFKGVEMATVKMLVIKFHKLNRVSLGLVTTDLLFFSLCTSGGNIIKIFRKVRKLSL